MKLIIIFISLVSFGCEVTSYELKHSEEICKDHAGVYLIQVKARNVTVCNDGYMESDK